MALEFTDAWNTRNMGPLAVTAHRGAVGRIVIADDFGRYPGGRFRADGDFSGEEFRDDYLLPELRRAKSDKRKVSVVLDGVAGYPASFLEEAFGGLVRLGHFTQHDLRNLLSIESGALFQTYKLLVWKYIDEARPQR